MPLRLVIVTSDTGSSTKDAGTSAAGRTKVAVIGAAGRMGTAVCEGVLAADDLDLVGRFDVGDELGDLGGAEVVVEFSVPSASP